MDKDTQKNEKQLVEQLISNLQRVRNDTRKNLERVAKLAEELSVAAQKDEFIEGFSEYAKNVSVECTGGMIDVVEEIMRSSVLVLLQKPPCSFNVVAIGSLARGEATPYSDLEYIFLLAPGSKTPQTVQYFEQLALTTYFLIGNLRETKLSYMAVEELHKWFVDKSKNGLKIDGLAPQAGNIPTGNGIPKTRIDEKPSGNIPTGNGDPLTKNHFITTPDSLAKRYEAILQNPVREDALMGDLTAMLAYMKTVYSYKHPQDQDRPDILLQLKELIADMEPNEKRRAVNKEMLEKDLEKFNFKPDHNLNDRGATVDVKKDLYRFPSLLVYDLSIVFGCVGDSIWETIDLLHERKHISKQIRKSILFQLACACYVRLSTYLHHDSHDDRVSLLEEFSVAQTSTTGGVKGDMARWHIPGGLLFSMCDYLIPLKREIQNHHGNLETVLMSENVKSDWLCTVQGMCYCGWNQKAFKFLCSEFGSTESHLFDGPDQLCGKFNVDLTSEICDLIGDVLYRVGHRVEAGKYYKAKTDGQTMMQGLKGLSLGIELETKGHTTSATTEKLSLDPMQLLLSQSEGLSFLSSFGFDLEDLKWWITKITNDLSQTTPNIPVLLKVLQVALKCVSTLAEHSKGIEKELKVCLEVSGIKDVALYDGYNKKAEAIIMCVMWNGDIMDRMLGIAAARYFNQVSTHESRNQPTSVAQMPEGKTQLATYMEIEPIERLDSFNSLSVTTWFVMVSFGIWYASLQEYDTAEAYILKAESLLSTKYGENAAISQNLAILGAKAMNLSLQGRKVESADLQRQSLQLCQKLYGDSMISPLTDLIKWIDKLDKGDELGSHLEFLKPEHIDAIYAVIMDWYSLTVKPPKSTEDDLD